MKSQNHINKNTGGDIRENNRTNNINTQWEHFIPEIPDRRRFLRCDRKNRNHMM